MSFSPVVPFGGYAGWSFLQRTMDRQVESFITSPTMQRDEDYFRAKIGSIRHAEDLVNDRRLLAVALNAFGLGADIDNKFFIRKVLEDGTLDPKALANRLADKQYLAFSRAFGFGDFAIPRTNLSDFAENIIAAWQPRQFEEAVGEQNGDLRLALNAKRELPTLASSNLGDDAMWFTIMGNPPLRQVFEKAFGLPPSFAALDIDQQLSELQGKAGRVFGDESIRQFTDPKKTEKLLRTFLARSEAAASFSSMAGGATALQLLQAAAP
ncbi:MAG: DUF1217 domain-containing protein [Pseudorhodobacter sp.]